MWAQGAGGVHFENMSGAYRQIGRGVFVNGDVTPRRRAQCRLADCSARRGSDDAIMTDTRKDGGILVEFEPMSPDEIQRTVQFLLRQQAQFAADFEKLAAKTDRLTDAVVGLTGVVGRLAEAQLRTDEQLRRMTERVDGLAVQIERTDSHLDVLIEMFERHLREDHGRPPS
jgi:hypothetical protein